MIPYSRQYIDKSDIKSIEKVLKSEFLTQGPLVKKFEKEFSKKVNSKFAIASNSATSSLLSACLALGLKKNDIVWTVPITFAATVNCIINSGAKVDFVDIDNKTFNISVKELEKKLELSKRKNKLPKLVIPVHLGGQPSDQKKIFNLSLKYKFKILEDASHSLGATHNREMVGSCKWSDLCVFSFHPVKVMTTGEGGMITTNNKILYDKIKKIQNNGIEKNFSAFKNKNKAPWYYEYQSPGFNFRMNEISAALGLSQLKKLKYFIKERNKINLIYRSKLKKIPIEFQTILKSNVSTFHLQIIKFNLKYTKHNYRKIFESFRKKGFFVNLHYMPLHKSPLLKKKFKFKKFPNSENYASTCISIPNYVGLNKNQISKVCALIKNLHK